MIRLREEGNHKYFEYVSKNGVVYSLLEGLTIGDRLTSDYVFIMLDGYDSDKETFYPRFVDFICGCMDMESEEYRQYVEYDIDKIVDKFENENPGLIDDIKNGKYERI